MNETTLPGAAPQAGSTATPNNNPAPAAAPDNPATQGTPPATPGTTTQLPTQPGTTEPAAPAAPPAAPYLTIQHNHRQKDLTEAEAREYAQKGINYEKAIERAKNEAQDAFIASQGYIWDNKPVTNREEYQRAMFEKSLVDKGVPLADARLAYDKHPDVVRAREIQAQAKKDAEKDAEDQDMSNFLESFEKENGHAYDPKTDGEIPKEVWEENKRGTPMALAYKAIVVPKKLSERIKQLETEAQKAKVNAQNAASSTGSVAGDGGGQQKTFFTREEASAMSPAEERKHHEEIRESMKKW